MKAVRIQPVMTVTVIKIDVFISDFAMMAKKFTIAARIKAELWLNDANGLSLKVKAGKIDMNDIQKSDAESSKMTSWKIIEIRLNFRVKNILNDHLENFCIHEMFGKTFILFDELSVQSLYEDLLAHV